MLTETPRQMNDRGFYGAFTPLRDPIVLDDSVGTTSKLAVSDHPRNLSFNLRRIRIYNTSTNRTVGVCLVDIGAAPTSGVYANAIKIPPGQVWSIAVDASHRILTIGSALSSTYNLMVDDV